VEEVDQQGVHVAQHLLDRAGGAATAVVSNHSRAQVWAIFWAHSTSDSEGGSL
jgi:hypothetical protein